MAVSLSAWMMFGHEPAYVGARLRVPGISVFATIHRQLLRDGRAVLPADVADAPSLRLASLSHAAFESRWSTDNSADTTITTASATSFDDRFSSDSPAPPTRSLPPSPPSRSLQPSPPTGSLQAAPPNRSLQPSSTFGERFARAIASGPPPNQFTLASLPPTDQFLLASVPPTMEPAPAVTPAPAPAVTPAPAPHAAARALMARVGSKRTEHQERQASAPRRVASLGDTAIRTAYASPDSANRDIDDSLLKKMMPRDPAPKDSATHSDMSHTAIYDITAHAVYLPDGRRLEAHSGLGEHMDDLSSVSQRDIGPTPPGVYDLTMREASFHGVDAIRLNPVDNGKMYGRAGILAHPYMMGPNGQSNGCVSFKDYNAFLTAFRHGEFNRMVVVERLDNPPGGQTAAGWIADKLKGLFGQS